MNQQNQTLPLVFNSKVTLRFRDADPAGVMFFGNIMGLAHDVFEDFARFNDIPWDEWFKNSNFVCPIRHTEVDYQAPMIPGHDYQIIAKIVKISQSSFTMHYEFRNEQNKLCVRVQMVHVFVDPKTMQKTAFPEKYLKVFTKYCLPDANDFNFQN